MNSRSNALAIGIAIGMGFTIPLLVLMLDDDNKAPTAVMAPKVQTYALEHFDELDVDKDKTLTADELKYAASKPKLPAEEKAILDFMRDNMDTIGHVIGTETSTDFIWIPTGDGGGFFSPIITTHNIYGINSQDLESYLNRLKKK